MSSHFFDPSSWKWRNRKQAVKWPMMWKRSHHFYQESKNHRWMDESCFAFWIFMNRAPHHEHALPGWSCQTWLWRNLGGWASFFYGNVMGMSWGTWGKWGLQTVWSGFWTFWAILWFYECFMNPVGDFDPNKPGRFQPPLTSPRHPQRGADLLTGPWVCREARHPMQMSNLVGCLSRWNVYQVWWYLILCRL